MKLCSLIWFSLWFALIAANIVDLEQNTQELLREIVVDYNVRNNSVREEVIQTWYTSDFQDRLKFASGIVSQKCLQCICEMESKCKPIGCHMDVGSESCGYFQIKQTYWVDCGKPGRDFKSCADDITCSSQCVQNFMKRYAKHYKCPLNCEGFSREHNGGPNGCHNKNTLKYWEKLQKIPGCRGVQLP